MRTRSGRKIKYTAPNPLERYKKKDLVKEIERLERELQASRRRSRSPKRRSKSPKRRSRSPKRRSKTPKKFVPPKGGMGALLAQLGAGKHSLKKASGTTGKGKKHMSLAQMAVEQRKHLRKTSPRKRRSKSPVKKTEFELMLEERRKKKGHFKSKRRTKRRSRH